MDRRYKLKAGQKPEALAALGGGDKAELHAVNKTWMSSDFQPWNPGQEMVIPPAWKGIPDEYPGGV